MTFFTYLLELSLEAAPWLVLGLIIGGLIKVIIPTKLLHKHLTGDGFLSVMKAALFGAPLPLCSCGVIPAALGLRKAGASKSATISFLVSTPETGIDSVSVSYALLGPFMAIVRPVAAIVSAITAGLLVARSKELNPAVNLNKVNEKDEKEASCCAIPTAVEEQDSCCGSEKSEDENSQTNLFQKMKEGIVYSFVDLFDKILFWLCIGIFFAAAVKTFVPISFLTEWNGFPAMIVMLFVGIPMYVCAVASTPIAAGLLLAGISPGTAMVFLMAGPATNISTLGVIKKELGRQSLIAYLVGVCVTALITGFIVDYLVAHLGIDIQGQIAHNHEMIPEYIEWMALLLLLSVVTKLKLAKFIQLKSAI